jgi:hypothetical protein
MTGKKRHSRIFAIIFFLQMDIYDCDIMIWIKISLSVAGYHCSVLELELEKRSVRSSGSCSLRMS